MFRGMLLGAAAVVAASFLALGTGHHSAQADGITLTVATACATDWHAPFDGKLDCVTSHPFGVKHVKVEIPTTWKGVSLVLYDQDFDCESPVSFSVVDLGVSVVEHIETTPCLPNEGIDDFLAPGFEPSRISRYADSGPGAMVAKP